MVGSPHDEVGYYLQIWVDLDLDGVYSSTITNVPIQTNPSNYLPPGTARIRKAIPVNLPLVVGKTSPTALAAPVALGIMLQDAARPPRQSCVGANDLKSKETGALYGAQELHMTARTPIMWNFILAEYVYIYIYTYSKYVSIYVVHIVECAGFIKSPQATGPHLVEIRTALAQHRKV